VFCKNRSPIKSRYTLLKYQHPDYIKKATIDLTGFAYALFNNSTYKYVVLTFKLVLILFITLSFSQPVFSAENETSYSTLKAVFLERLTRFIDWPDSPNLSNPELPFIIGVFGNKEFTTQLTDIYQTKKILNKNVIVQELFTPDEILGCHLIFISNNTEHQLSKIIDIAKNNSVLTVSDTSGFSQKGVLINFFITGDNIRFEINETAAKEAGFQMSYKLLSVAEIVETIEK